MARYYSLVELWRARCRTWEARWGQKGSLASRQIQKEIGSGITGIVWGFCVTRTGTDAEVIDRITRAEMTHGLGNEV